MFLALSGMSKLEPNTLEMDIEYVLVKMLLYSICGGLFLGIIIANICRFWLRFT